MPDYTGYRGRALALLESSGAAVGDSVRVSAGAEYSGIVMPRREGGGDGHVVLKLGSGYNVGLEVSSISGMERTGGAAEPAPAPAAPEAAAGLPRVLLLSTGGTIASRIDYRTGAVTPGLTAADIGAMAPELAGIAAVETEEVISEYSENIVPSDWAAIAGRIAAAEGYAGIIVAHGTDTMHYTAAFLSFALAGFPVPIVMTGSQRSPDRASSDAAPNLVGAARLVTEAGEPGVYVAMHLDGSDGAIACHAGTRARKNHTSRRGAFETVGGEPAFVVTGDGVRRNMAGRFFASEEFSPRIRLDERAALVKYYPGYDPGTLDHIVGSGARAVIFEGTGLGHVGRAMYGSVRRAAEAGVFLGMTSQCIGGRVSMTVYESGRDLLGMGVVPLGDMLPETALAKAMWAAGNAEDRDGIEGLMLQNVASETSGEGA